MDNAPRPPVDMRLDRVPHGAEHLPAVAFPASLRRVALAIAGSLVFVLLGAWIVVDDRWSQDAAVIGVVTVLVFGAFALIGLYGFVRRLGVVALSPAGIHGGARSEVFVPWRAVRAVQPLTIRRSSMVGLDVADDPLVRIPRAMRVGRDLSRAMYGVDVAVGGPTDRGRAEGIAALIAWYAQDPARHEEIGRALPPAEAFAPPQAAIAAGRW